LFPTLIRGKSLFGQETHPPVWARYSGKQNVKQLFPAPMRLNRQIPHLSGNHPGLVLGGQDSHRIMIMMGGIQHLRIGATLLSQLRHSRLGDVEPGYQFPCFVGFNKADIHFRIMFKTNRHGNNRRHGHRDQHIGNSR
jgi:hypothetical protein